jgi:hypothetical protein
MSKLAINGGSPVARLRMPAWPIHSDMDCVVEAIHKMHRQQDDLRQPAQGTAKVTRYWVS